MSDNGSSLSPRLETITRKIIRNGAAARADGQRASLTRSPAAARYVFHSTERLPRPSPATARQTVRNLASAFCREMLPDHASGRAGGSGSLGSAGGDVVELQSRRPVTIDTARRRRRTQPGTDRLSRSCIALPLPLQPHPASPTTAAHRWQTADVRLECFNQRKALISESTSGRHEPLQQRCSAAAELNRENVRPTNFSNNNLQL